MCLRVWGMNGTFSLIFLVSSFLSIFNNPTRCAQPLHCYHHLYPYTIFKSFFVLLQVCNRKKKRWNLHNSFTLKWTLLPYIFSVVFLRFFGSSFISFCHIFSWYSGACLLKSLHTCILNTLWKKDILCYFCHIFVLLALFQNSLNASLTWLSYAHGLSYVLEGRRNESLNGKEKSYRLAVTYSVPKTLRLVRPQKYRIVVIVVGLSFSWKSKQDDDTLHLQMYLRLFSNTKM